MTPGIYADIANTQNVIVGTNLSNGQISQQTVWECSSAMMLRPDSYDPLTIPYEFYMDSFRFGTVL